ncbi:MAG: flagellar hook assembly protein FlgD [Proteobacteria bacterium]|nr:flagellar hook assembly protein FlgD [Pseudomonadota bacterium]MBU1649772.1 flagellar hook assembly protein FlgD [Pseudomonadota bacterium]
MTTISPDTYSFSTAAATSTTSTAANTSIMGKEDFLILLVAQLKNQDPLNPEDPTAFTAQLAQFSSLEQLTNLNKSMEGLTTAQANSERLSALSLIGKNISYNGSAFNFEGQPVEMGYQIDGTASSVTLSIQNSEGKTVNTIQASAAELGAGNHFITWDGTDQNGNLVANGKYKIVLQANAAGENSSIAAAPLIKSEVTGVDLSSGMITTKDGEVLFMNIIGVSEPANSLQNTTLTNTNSINAATGTVASLLTENAPVTDNGQTAQDIIDRFIQQTQP